MALPDELISQLIKVTNNNSKRGMEKGDNVVYGTIVNNGDRQFVQLDGSDCLTPATSLVEINPDERVAVTIENHTATILGNATNPSVGVKTAEGLRSEISQTADEIKLLVEDTANSLQSSITINADQITSLSSRMGEAESSITQNADSITSVVKRVGDSELNITTLDGNLGSLVDRVSDNETTVDDLTARVTNAESSITQNADSISSVVKGQVTLENTVTGMQETQDVFSEFKQTVEGFSFMGTGGTVKIQGGDINLTGAITWGNLSSTVQDEITDAQNTASTAQSTANNAADTASTALTRANSAKTTANNAADDAAGALETISGFTITKGTTTYIDGQMIYTDSIYADSMHLGGSLAVYKTLYGNTVGGYLGYDDGFNSIAGIGIRDSTEKNQMVCTNSAARLSSGDPTSDSTYSQFVASSGGSATIEATTTIFMELSNVAVAVITDHSTYYSLRPNTNSTVCLGTSAWPWDTVYADTCTGSTSDRNKKNSIETLPEKYLDLFDNLEPRRFKLNNGTSDRYHVGYIAQEVEEAMVLAGIDSQEFGGFIRDKDENGNDIYLLRYGEFDAIRDAKIKQLEAKNLELEARIAALEKLLTQ